jgi:hypothetical protein
MGKKLYNKVIARTSLLKGTASMSHRDEVEGTQSSRRNLQTVSQGIESG